MLTRILSSALIPQGIILLLLMRYLAVTAPKRTRIGEMDWRMKNARFDFQQLLSLLQNRTILS
jgi:hypothetical protein